MSAKLLKSTFTVGGNTLISRVLGFVRDMVLARVFGASAGTDAFFVAFKLPNFLRRLFAEGAFSQAFVPVLAEYRERRGEGEVRELLARVSGTLGAILAVLTVIGILAAPVLIGIFAPGFLDEPRKYLLATDMLRVTFPYLFFISMTALAGAVLNSWGRFGVPAFTPVFLNLALISVAIWLSPRMAEPVTALAWGVLISGIAQLAFQFPFLRRLGLLAWPRWGWAHEGVRRIVRLMLPAMFGASVVQLNLLVDTIIATFLATGSVTWLYYADRMVEFPLGVFGIALATVILPSLSRSHAAEDGDLFARKLDWALRWLLLIGPAAALGLFLLAEPILTTLFQYERFAAADVRMAALALLAYALGLPGFMLIKVLAPGFFARQDTKTPVRAGIIAMIVNIVLNFVLVGAMLHFELAGPHAGLALATGLSAYVNAAILYRHLRRDGVLRAQPGWPVLLARCLAALAVMGGLLIWLVPATDAWLAWDWARRVTQLALWIGAGAGVYFLTLWLAGLRPGMLSMRERKHATEPRSE